MFPPGIRLVLAQAGVERVSGAVFLFALELIDTYKLLTLGRVLRSVGWDAAWRWFATASTRRFMHRGIRRRRSGRDRARR
jgi:hypothetical protein